MSLSDVHPPHRVPGNAIGPEGARAVADALTVNTTVTTIFLDSMALPLDGRCHSICRIVRQCYECSFFNPRVTSDFSLEIFLLHAG